MNKAICIALLAITPCVADAENKITVEKLSDQNFRLTLTSTEALDANKAQGMLLPAAESLCEGRRPKFGYYRFDSTESITGSSSTDSKESFELVQDLECVSANSNAEVENKSFVSDSDHRAAVEAQVRALSETYFAEIFGGKYEDAYLRQSKSARSFRTFDEWATQMDKLREDAGDIDELNIHTITIYDNPPNSPEPGLYVAADFQNKFLRAPYHCGYLVWFQSDSHEFEIIREESGLITNMTLLQIPEDQLSNLLAEFLCSGPE